MKSKIDRLLGKREIAANGCWEWRGCLTQKGYGRFKMDGQCFLAHRASWLLQRGEIPAGMCVCHHCDNPACINPDHLFLGTNEDNVKDRVLKGRSARSDGEHNANAKLSWSDVYFIRSSDKTSTELAGQYGLTIAAVAKVKRGATWRSAA